MTVAIDKNIPPPGRAVKWPWLQMKPGDSFFAPGYFTMNKDRSPCLSASWAKRLVPGSQWTMRATVENGVSGVRVWRVK